MGLTDEEREMARPKIAVVRDTLNQTGSMEMNPFFAHIDQERLLEIFEDLANDVERAGAKLSRMTGVDAPDWSRNGSGYLADGLIAESLINKISIEMTLSNTFSRTTVAPYSALRDLEKGEAKAGHHCPEKAREAMDGLVSLHAVVKAIPLVYEQISRIEPNPARAIA